MKPTAAMLSAGALNLGITGDPVRAAPGQAAAARVLHAEVVARRTPGVQYQHFTKDEVLFAYGEGFADTQRGLHVAESTTFNGFSVTKTITAVGILQLVDCGRIDLDASARTYLSEFPYPQAITVRQLLAHSAGVPNPLPLSWIHRAEEHSTFEPRAFFQEVFADRSNVRFRPNTRMKYSNLGYVLLGWIIENASGLPYEQYVTENILNPIGLTPAELGFTRNPQTHATGYHKRRSFSRLLLRFLIDDAKYVQPGRGQWHAFRPYYVNGAPYGGIIGSASGFTRYLQALLEPSSGLLSSRSRQALFSENVLNDGSRSGMALSWFRGELDGHVYYAHSGGGGGYYAEIRIYPQFGRGSVVLFNRTGFSDERFLDKVDRHLLGP
jgi:D-alanyl-D-alanine carboxypeptidase